MVNNVAYSVFISPSGCYTRYRTTTANDIDVALNGVARPNERLTLSASASSSTYKDVATIQPEAIQTLMIIKV